MAWGNTNNMRSTITKIVAEVMQKGNVNEVGWLCLCKDCDFAKAGTRNYQSRKKCWSCLRPKDTATNPPVFARLPQRFDKDHTMRNSDDTSKKEQHKRETRTRKREARKAAALTAKPPDRIVAAIPPAEVKTATQSSTPPKQPKAKLCLPDKVLEQIGLLLPDAAKVVLDNLAMEVVPTMPDCKAPENVMNKFIGERGPSAKLAKKEELQAEITRYESALVIFGEAGDPAIVESIKAKLKTAEDALAKATKDAPSQDHELKAVQEAKSSYEVFIQARKDREVKGAQKATERKTTRREHLKILKDQLTILENGLKEVEDENDKGHLQKTTAAAELDVKVLALFDQTIAALSPARANPGPSTSPQTQPALAILPPVPQDSLDQLEQYKKQIGELTALLQAGASKVQQEFDRSFVIAAAELPQTPKPSKEQMPIYGSLFSALQNWNVSGACQPFDWKALDQLTGPDVTAAQVASYVLGDFLKKWYPDGEPGSDAVVPKQIGLLLVHLLNKLTGEFEQAETKEAISALTATNQDVMTNAAKRLRVER